MNAFEKLFIARTLLALNQKEAAEQAGIHPATLSILERGEKKFIPTEYLHFLHSKGIDINWIFSDTDNSNAVFRQEQLKIRHGSVSVKKIHNEECADTRVVIHKHNMLPDIELKEILEELKKLNTHLSIAQSSISNVYGN